MLERVEATSTWDAYMDSVCLARVSKSKLMGMWLESVKRSLEVGYHSTNTDFGRIQKSGVSDILLRGKSFSRVVLCIDCSGSMGSYFNATDGDGRGRQVSRLDFVKAEISSIFANKITHRHQFNIVQFDHRVRVWSKGLVQGTDSNVADALGFVRQWEAGGGTDILAALEACFSMDGVQAVYLLSDGEVYNCDAVVEAAARLSKRGGGIQCHTTSFFAPLSGQHMLARVAEVTGGSFLHFDGK
jgi:hypothetical protein